MFGQSALDSGEDRLPWDEGTWALTTLVCEGEKGRKGVVVIGHVFPSSIDIHDGHLPRLKPTRKAVLGRAVSPESLGSPHLAGPCLNQEACMYVGECFFEIVRSKIGGGLVLSRVGQVVHDGLQVGTGISLCKRFVGP